EADSPEPGTVALSDFVVSEHQQGRIAGKGAQRFGRIADDDFGVDRRVGSAVWMRGIEVSEPDRESGQHLVASRSELGFCRALRAGGSDDVDKVQGAAGPAQLLERPRGGLLARC